MGLYLAEQYWPDVTRQRLRAAVEAMLACRDGTDALGRVVAVLLTPHDECIFYLLDGRSVAAASDLVARTGRPADRVQPCERIDRHVNEPFRPDQGQALGQ